MGKAKSYVDELEEWLRKEDRGGRQHGEVSFLAVRASVQAAAESGYPLKTVWRHLTACGKYKLRYETFLKHAAKYLKKPAAKSSSSCKASPKTTGFSYTAAPNQEELI